MDRRGFLKRLAGACLAGLAITPKTKARANSVEREILELEAMIADFADARVSGAKNPPGLDDQAIELRRKQLDLMGRMEKHLIDVHRHLDR